MSVAKRLPAFSVGGFRSTVAAGAQKEAERNERERRRDEEKRRAKCAKREDETAMFVAPGMRPLAEAPELDWEWFERQFMPSDLRMRKLFPDNPEKRARAKDLMGERSALDEYGHWLAEMDADPGDERRRGFYEALSKEVYYDHMDVAEEVVELYTKATDLGRFEHEYLDNDGKTTGMEALLGEGEVLFWETSPEVQARYGPLLSTYAPLQRFEKRYEVVDGLLKGLKGQPTSQGLIYETLYLPDALLKMAQYQYNEPQGPVVKKYWSMLLSGLETFERLYCPGGDLKRLEESLRGSRKSLICEEYEAVQAKYGNILSRFLNLRAFKMKYVDMDGWGQLVDTRRLEGLLQGGTTLQYMDDEVVMEEYGTLISKYANLRKFKEKFIYDDGSTEWMEELLKDNETLTWERDEAVKAKYGHILRGYPLLRRLEAKWIDKDGGTERLRERMKASSSTLFLFSYGKEAREKYGYLAPSDLGRWQYRYLDDDLGTEGVQKLVNDGVDVLEGYDESVRKAFLYITRTSSSDGEDDEEQEESEDVSEESNDSNEVSSESTEDWASALGDDDREAES